LDHAPVVTELSGLIEDRIKIIAPRGKVSLARELLDGWWWHAFAMHCKKNGGTISILELEAKLDDIR